MMCIETGPGKCTHDAFSLNDRVILRWNSRLVTTSYTEVNQSHTVGVLHREENVLRLDVSMYDPMRVYVFQG